MPTPRSVSLHHRSRFAALVAAIGMLTAVSIATGRVSAASIETPYVVGHRDVTINGYGTAGMGAFALAVDGSHRLAWCLEAHVAHTTTADAYRPVPAEHSSADLDTLLWILERTAPLDDDTATAGAALAWWYAGARRSIGPPVWSDGSDGFATIDPFRPVDWSDLPPITVDQPIGLRSGSVDLDAAERRVVELHRTVSAWRGAWEIVVDDAARVVVRGPAGPISGAQATLTARRPDGPDRTVHVTTESDGAVPTTGLLGSLGGSITVRVEAPGPHHEWDGAGSVQRLATAVSTTLEAVVVLDAPPRHIEILKISADPTISPAGAVFEVQDSLGRVVERVHTTATGTVRLGPVDVNAHPPPFTIVEVLAPVGLSLADQVVLTDASIDPEQPTIVTVVDPPLLVDVVVRKRLSVPAVGPRDLSGFDFAVTRMSDGWTLHATTAPDGRSVPLGLALGEYEVCETGTPTWAVQLVDGGCRRLTVVPDDLHRSEPITVDYVNLVAPPTIDTEVVDPIDGDQLLPPDGGALIDRVSIDGTIIGTRYRYTGRVMTRSGTATEVGAAIEFTAIDDRTDLELELDIRGLAAGAYVVIGRLEVARSDATDVVEIAAHDDLADVDQTFTIATRPILVEEVEQAPPTSSTVAQRLPSSTLPSTGADGLRAALRIADATFVLGAALGVLGATRRTVRR